MQKGKAEKSLDVFSRSLLSDWNVSKDQRLIQRPLFSLFFFDDAPVGRRHSGNHVIKISHVIPIVSAPDQSALSDVFLLQSVFHVVRGESAVLAVLDDRLGGDVHVEVTFVAGVHTQLLTGQGEFTLLTLIDQHRTRTRTDDENARAKSLDLQRGGNALQEDFTFLEIVDHHVFARELCGLHTDQFILLVADRHGVRRDDDIGHGRRRDFCFYFALRLFRVTPREADAMARGERPISKRV